MKTAKKYYDEWTAPELGEEFVGRVQQDVLDAVKAFLNKKLVPVSFEGYPIKAVPQVTIIDELKLENL